MKRPSFLKSPLALGGAASVPAGLAAGVMSGSECKDTGAGFHPLAVAERGEIALKT